MLPRHALLRPQTQTDRGHCARMQVDKVSFYRQDLKHQTLRMPELRQEVGLWHPHAFPAGPPPLGISRNPYDYRVDRIELRLHAHETCAFPMHGHRKGQFMLSGLQNSCSHDSKRNSGARSELNVAYQALLDPLSHAEHILKLRGIEVLECEQHMALAMCLCRKSTIIKRLLKRQIRGFTLTKLGLRSFWRTIDVRADCLLYIHDLCFLCSQYPRDSF